MKVQRRNTIFAVSLGLAVVAARSDSFDISRSDNLIAQWGQAQYEERLLAYCDDTVDAVTIGYLQYNGSSLPSFTSTTVKSIQRSGCGAAVFPDSQLTDCPVFADDIKACQSQGKAVILSLDPGHGSTSDWYASESTARAYANLIWDSFLGGDSLIRPFGDAVFDGVKVEAPRTGDVKAYWSFFDELRHLSGPSSSSPTAKPCILIAAVWCFSLEFLRNVLTPTSLDALFIAVFQGSCSVAHYDDKTQWNYDKWDSSWSSSSGALNKNIKLYLSVLARPYSGMDFVDSTRLSQIAIETRSRFPTSFGGVTYGDAASAIANGGYNGQLRQALLNVDQPSTPTSPTGQPSNATLPTPPQSSNSASTTVSQSPPLSPNNNTASAPPDSLDPQPSPVPSKLTVILATLIPIITLTALGLAGMLWHLRRRNKEGIIRAYNAGQHHGERDTEQSVDSPEHSNNYLYVKEKPLDHQPEPLAATTSSSFESDLPDELQDLQALRSEIGRVGFSIPALLSSLSRLRAPPFRDLPFHVESSDSSETAVPPPQYE